MTTARGDHYFGRHVAKMIGGWHRPKTEPLLRLVPIQMKRRAANNQANGSSRTYVVCEGATVIGRGCGFVDISLLASALLSDHTLLWTMDKRLAAVATELGRA